MKQSAKLTWPSKSEEGYAIATPTAESGFRHPAAGLLWPVLLGLCLGACAGPPSPVAHGTPNLPGHRLAQQRSPYLRQHVDNAVEWYPWGDEAFTRARAENKPVFLSVGYSTCHWCHVMEEESFMNPQVGQMLNEHFVPIKVDRETRPDIDRLYMSFLVSTTGKGGWPMSVFLTPDAQPFMAGTYYPQPARYGKIGFLDLLTEIQQAWDSDSTGTKAEAAKIASRMAQAALQPASAQPPEPDLANQALSYWRKTFDQQHGGFGPQPKFPQATLLAFLLDHGCLFPESGAETLALRTLEAIALGGIRDHIEGGFHRYSIDKTWRVPHFEKMLSDQAQLLSLYSRAYALTGKPLFKEAARSTAEYVEQRLKLDGGGLASAEDADSVSPENPREHAEGAFYVWTEAQVDSHLSPIEADLVKKLFAVTRQGNAGPELAGKNVLAVARPELLTDPRTTAALGRLREARDQRPRPARDEKVLLAWNAMAAGALAQASVALRRPDYLTRARSVLTFIEASLVVDGALQRSFFGGKAEVAAFAHDHAELVAAYLSVYRASGEPSALERAVFWQQQQDRLFADPTSGGYFETMAQHGLLYRDKETQDGANASTASRSALNLVHLYRLTGQDSYRETYDSLLKSLGSTFSQYPRSLPGVLAAMDLMNGPEESAILVGERPDWWDLLQSGYHPQRSLHWVRDPQSRKALSALVPFSAGLPAKEAVYFCQDFTCGLPIDSVEGLQRRLSP